MKALVVCLLSAILAAAGSLNAGQIVCRFDAGTAADVNDLGDRQTTGGWALSPPGTGCPANPQGRALATGKPGTPGGPADVIEVPVSPNLSLAQGTIEVWVRTAWDWAADRDHHSFVYIKMEGGPWNSLALYHHGDMGGAHTLAFNIYDSVDNCVLCTAESLGWRQDEWHYLAVSWTPHGEWLFADGRLVAKRLYPKAMCFTAPAGPLRIAPPGMWGSVCGALVDEVRFVDRALYAGMESIPVPTAPLPDRLDLGLLGRPGVAVSASSTMPDHVEETDVPELHDGTFGQTVWLNGARDAWVRADLPRRADVAAVRWSRDGRPLKSADDWADARNIPRDLRIEVTTDGERWQTVAEARDLWYDPAAIPREGMVFERRFTPVPATAVRLVVTKGQPGSLGPLTALDEFQVLDAAGANLARDATLVTTRTSRRTQYAVARLTDGGVGEESCWRAARPGEATIEIVMPEPAEARQLSWSRSADGLAAEGTPKDMVVEAETGGAWVEVGRVTGNDSAARHDLALKPVTASRLRLRILSTTDGKEPALDEITLH